MADVTLLHAIPASTVPPRRAPHGGAAVPALCAGTEIAAERLRYLAPVTARRGHGPDAATAASWQRTAHGAAITSHASRLILRALAARAGFLGIAPAIPAGLRQAADAAAQACTTWRTAAHCWDTITTGTRPHLTPVATEIADLVLWTGRLAYRDPHWAPAREHTATRRDPAGLAFTPTGIPGVLAAVHHATDALAHIAAADREAVRAAAATRRLFIPTRLLPERADVPRPYTLADDPHVDALLATYDTVIEAATRAAVILDDLAVTTGAPSSSLAAIRTAGRGGIPVLPGRHTHAPAPAADTGHHPGQVERTLRNLSITEPALLERAAAIDDDARHLITEARAKAQRRDAADTALHAKPIRADPRHPAHLAAKDSPHRPLAHLPAKETRAAPVADIPVRFPPAPGRGRQ